MSTLNPLPTASPAFMADLTAFLREEDADRFMFGWQPFVAAGGLHGPGAGLTGTPSALVAFPNGIFVTETGGITYADGSVSWVIADQDVAGNRGTYIRVPGTHYLVATGGPQPAVPVDAIPLMRVTTAGGAMTEVKDLRPMSPNRGIHTPGFAFSNAYPSLQAAIDALPDAGGTLFITPGTYVLTQTLRLGNGTAAHVSDRQGIQIVGLGAPFNASLGYTPNPSVKLVWAGGAAPVIEVAGPLAGWGIRGLAIDGGGVATHGVRVVSAQFGVLADCFIVGATRADVGTDTVTTFPGAANTNVLHNRFSNVFVGAAGLYALELNGSSPQAITEYNTFDNIFLVVVGNGIGLQLGACAHNVFTNLHISLGAGATAPINLAYDNGQSSAWPGGNIFFGLETHDKPMTQTGTAGVDLLPNQLFGVKASGLPSGFVPEIEGVAAYMTDVDGNIGILPAWNAAAAKVNGDVAITSTINHTHHLIPSIDAVADVGADTRRWRVGWFAGGIITNVQTISAGPTTLDAGYGTVPVDATAGPISVQLPLAASVPGKVYIFKKVDATANAVNIVPAGAEVIDGVAGTLAITTQWQTRTLQSNGTVWLRLDRA